MARLYDDLYHRLTANVREPLNEQSCWIWKRKLGSGGYPHINLRGPYGHQTLQAHIALWVWLETAPESMEEFWCYLITVQQSGLELDHQCEMEWCISPDHLDLVTHQENCVRMHQRRSR